MNSCLARPLTALGVAFLAANLNPCLHGQTSSRGPASKVYVSDINGEAFLDTGETVQELSKRTVYNAQGAVVETKGGAAVEEGTSAYSTLVFSNGTGAFYDTDTRVEMRRFVQEPFAPNRSDIEVEPSVSRTQAFVARGAVGLCNSKLVAGSVMIYDTPHASLSVRGRKVVIETRGDTTKFSMLEGDGSFRAGSGDLSTRNIPQGQQAIIRRRTDGRVNDVEIRPIPPEEVQSLDDRVAMACVAKRTVYFEVKEKVETASAARGSGESGSASSTSSGDSSSGGSVASASSGSVSAFTPQTTTTELVAVQVVPVSMPVQFTVSPARIDPTR